MSADSLAAAMARLDPILALAVARDLARQGDDTSELQDAAIAVLAVSQQEQNDAEFVVPSSEGRRAAI